MTKDLYHRLPSFSIQFISICNKYMFSVQLHFYDTEKEKKKKPQITIAVSDRWYGVVERCRADDKRTRKREREILTREIDFSCIR